MNTLFYFALFHTAPEGGFWVSFPDFPECFTQGETIEETYAKEYGTDCIQIHKDAISENDIVLLHDDLLATGGTMAAAYRLVEKCGAKKTYINFVIELEELNGRKAFPEEVDVTTLLKR